MLNISETLILIFSTARDAPRTRPSLLTRKNLQYFRGLLILVTYKDWLCNGDPVDLLRTEHEQSGLFLPGSPITNICTFLRSTHYFLNDTVNLKKG